MDLFVGGHKGELELELKLENRNASNQGGERG